MYCLGGGPCGCGVERQRDPAFPCQWSWSGRGCNQHTTEGLWGDRPVRPGGAGHYCRLQLHMLPDITRYHRQLCHIPHVSQPPVSLVSRSFILFPRVSEEELLLKQCSSRHWTCHCHIMSSHDVIDQLVLYIQHCYVYIHFSICVDVYKY